MWIVPGKFVFLEFPHTGTSWLVGVLMKRYGSALVRGPSKHARASEIPPEYAHLPKFGFLRHPLDWMDSEHRLGSTLSVQELLSEYARHLQIFDTKEILILPYEKDIEPTVRRFFPDIFEEAA